MRALLLLVLALSPGLWAQESIPAGTVLPVQLASSLDSRKCKPGQAVTGRIMQDVPLPGGAKVPARARVTAQVVSTATLPDGRAAVALRFDTLSFRGRTFQLSTNLRAMASMMEVQDAQTPTTAPGFGDVWYWMDFVQVGGEAVYGLGPVTHGSEVVGESVPGGVLVKVSANPARGCRAAVAGNNRPQALWVFASDACGLYGFPELEIVHSGRTAPLGQIVLRSTQGPLHLNGGSGLLLRVNSSDPR